MANTIPHVQRSTADNEVGVCHPRAWLNAKRAFGVDLANPFSGGPAGRALVALEREAAATGQNVRLDLMAAVRIFLAFTPEQRAALRPMVYAADKVETDAFEAERAALLVPINLDDPCPYCGRQPYRRPQDMSKHIRDAHGFTPAQVREGTRMYGEQAWGRTGGAHVA